MLELPAPAKLNLFLHVTGRRDDGYHELQTCFQLLDHGDRIRLRRTESGGIRRLGGLPGLPPERDLVVRAAQRLQEATGCRLGAEIEVEKRLPAGAGLGGGSSDAATVLLGLDRLWGLGLSIEELARIGLELGADVPVFVRGRSAWGEGVGERLVPLPLPPRWYLVVTPEVAVSTAEIFAAPELTRNTPPITISDFLAGAGRNDCQPVVARRYPRIAELIDRLSQFAPARLTGTGASVFCAFDEAAAARAAQAALPPEWQAFVARGVAVSPLHLALGLAESV
ncbi:MAG: 4-(cytidine 5'-diphospho)-2-C-methyl-D-erythritol kinase [Gammaproteobacteria bacterium]|nr:MAG: 4-(cytidine 5'-diphospho)-2-C-methyl-D-erythritol kinase [Gammaproteobacteria bacterium]